MKKNEEGDGPTDYAAALDSLWPMNNVKPSHRPINYTEKGERHAHCST